MHIPPWHSLASGPTNDRRGFILIRCPTDFPTKISTRNESLVGTPPLNMQGSAKHKGTKKIKIKRYTSVSLHRRWYFSCTLLASAITSSWWWQWTAVLSSGTSANPCKSKKRSWRMGKRLLFTYRPGISTERMKGKQTIHFWAKSLQPIWMLLQHYHLHPPLSHGPGVLLYRRPSISLSRIFLWRAWEPDRSKAQRRNQITQWPFYSKCLVTWLISFLVFASKIMWW